MFKEPYAFVFGGQATPWRPAIATIAEDYTLKAKITELIEASDALLRPVAAELAAIGAGKLNLENLARSESPVYSVPGILAVQVAHLHALTRTVPVPEVVLGHSQGVLGAEAARNWGGDIAPVFALARLIGAAATRVAGTGPHMLAVNGLPRVMMNEILDRHGLSIGLVNGRERFVISGKPAELAKVRSEIEAEVASVNRDLTQKKRGGSPLTAQIEMLVTEAPFHSELLAPALELVNAWGARCGIDTSLAPAVLTVAEDWPAQIRSALEAGVTWFVDLGPGSGMSTLTKELIEGSGGGMAPAGTLEAIDALPLAKLTRSADWSAFAPKLLNVGGQTVVSTEFSRLTGYSPVLLAGMTPTTVDPEIVAAAANRGFWAEMAGGGQVTAEVFDSNVTKLSRLLEEGRTAQFNAMFMDRYLWNLQFGGQRVVSKARESGAPLSGVVVSAGIPELDEAPALIEELTGSGFTHIAFKPGTINQIRQVLAINELTDHRIILHVEDGHAGGHHSWENLDDLLLATYGEMRNTDVIICVGGGIGTPERAAEYLTGSWAARYDMPAMPVDGVLIGTAAMTAKEAKTTRAVKQLLVDTPGISDGWVAAGGTGGGVTSGLSHLRADMYEIDNDAAACARLIAEVESKPEQIKARRAEIIEALNKTAKPYFGELADMTYADVLNRFIDLSFPWVDPSWSARFIDLAHRIEARLAPLDHGEVVSIITDQDAEDPHAAAARLLQAYPQAREDHVTPADAAWFVSLCRAYPKPVGFVPAIDDDLLRWWGQDSLWQSQDDRYDANQVRIIPGPVSVAGITTMDEPIGDLLSRYEQAAINSIDTDVTPAFSRLGGATDQVEFLRACPLISWTGHLMANPVYTLDPSIVDIELDGDTALLTINLDTYWDEQTAHAVRTLTIPLLLPTSVATGGVPVVDETRLPESMFALLSATAGVGNTAVQGDHIDALPEMVDSERSQYGEAHYSFTLSDNLGSDHAGVTGGLVSIVPDALLGTCWPAIYAALGSARVDDYPVIEGLLNAVHLDHGLTLTVPASDLATGRIDVVAWADSVAESSSGRIVDVRLELSRDGAPVGTMRERFAIRGRAHGTATPADPQVAGGYEAEVRDTPRSVLAKTTVTSPDDMTPFAWVSGDFNPIHTSHAAAKVAGLEAPLVHGMWLSATAQHVATKAAGPIVGWTYRMFGLVDLNQDVDITVERTGRLTGGGILLEVTCKIDGELVSQATAMTPGPLTAYVYPGQGIQTPGMGLNERGQSRAAAEVWERADAHTRKVHGFSILTVVADNPTELTARGVTYRHPEGVLNLTQFTQVALATLAFAQTERLREAGALADGAFFAGHSLGEYNALSAYAGVIDLETVIEVVFHRGQAMHNLVERDELGRSNYALGALRPNQFGVGDDQVKDYVASVAEASGEFLEIVNYNLAGAQYAVAGTKAGLAALAEDSAGRAAAYGGKGPFMLIPGIDVPFHSAVLHAGVPEFREKLTELFPADLDYEILIGRYIPNLTATPFRLDKAFIDEILAVVPSQELENAKQQWESMPDTDKARLLLVELLAWQFASPVRWIETQELLISSGVAQFIEIGLGAAPTLANLATKTLATHVEDVTVLNVGRDEKIVYHEDVQVIEDEDVEPAEPAPAAPAAPAAATPAVPTPSETAAPAPAPVGGERPADIAFTPSDAVRTLLASANKIRRDQIGDADTVGTLTNGVSSRLNQLLMDFSAELGLASIEGAAEADMTTLGATVDRAARTYSAFGPVLSEQLKSLRKVLGTAGLKPAAITERVTGVWGLGSGWADHVQVEMMLGTRTGSSARGGELSTLPASVSSAAQAHELIDQAVQAVGEARGITVTMPSNGSGPSATVDSAALGEFADQITGENGILASTARHILTTLGLTDVVEEVAEDDTALVDAVEAELGSGWLESVAPRFEAAKAVLIDDRWASARLDLARLALGEDVTGTFHATGEAVAKQARWWAAQGKNVGDVESQALATGGAYVGKVAVVTGMAPTSIAGAIVADLLAGGATVIATASRITADRLAFAKKLYRENATGEASLWLVPANLSSYRDVEALSAWIGGEQTEAVGSETKLVKPTMAVDYFFPFAAPPVSGTLDDVSGSTESQARLLLWSVEKAMMSLSVLGRATNTDHRMHVVLPGSPNRGTFGGDGAYGETKAGFDAICNKWRVEPWAERLTIAHPRIGWVGGTSLMGGNDPLIEAAQDAGIHVWSPAEISSHILDLCSDESIAKASQEPLQADLTGGLDKVDLAALKANATVETTEEEVASEPTVSALPSPTRAVQPGMDWGQVTASLEDMVVIVGIGEVGPWGHGRTRFEAEYGIDSSGNVDLTPAGVLELAWMTGLLTWRDTPVAGWYDESDAMVEEADIFDRFRDEVVARCGVRSFVNDVAIEDLTSPKSVEVFLESDVTLSVDDEQVARSLVDADPQFTTAREVDGSWQVTKKAGAPIRVPQRATLARLVGGQYPTGFDPARWGIPASMIESIDRTAIWNLVSTVDAFLSAGFSPAEILEAVHPSDVAMTQGTGFGGMTSMRKLFVERFLDEEIPQDILQETLPNVIAAHTMQSFVGGYGSMIHPVGACATAAVSIEEGLDKIACGKAELVVAGAVDDISVESISGFASMNATANSVALAEAGINERFYSRANDRRRKGFVESQGGGTVLLARGSLAHKLGLPVYGVVGFAQSFADGAHTSIPAPGIGALAAGRGGTESRLARNLAGLGVSADDISVISKHDTSTNANDPNESKLHTLLANALGRADGNPYFIVSQKTLTGHAKGGAATFQVAGLLDMFRTGIVPGNASLDCVDPAMASSQRFVWPTAPINLGSVKAGLLTSLGFGHVSALVALVHPAAFEAAIEASFGADEAAAWREKATGRLAAGIRSRELGMLGHGPLFTPIEDRRVRSEDDEIAMLLDPDARLVDGWL